MIIYSLCFLLMNNQMVKSQEDVVSEFHAIQHKENEQIFIETYKNKSIDAQAYVLALEMKKAEYTILPWKKLDIFNTKKKEINALIAKYPENIHLRYMRLYLQENTPKILGYTTNIKEDKAFLKKKLETEDPSDYMDTYIKQNTSL
ncbi:MAG: hypothetical protein ACPG6V_09345 [Flavobacteriales bacterium]